MLTNKVQTATLLWVHIKN